MALKNKVFLQIRNTPYQNYPFSMSQPNRGIRPGGVVFGLPSLFPWERTGNKHPHLHAAPETRKPRNPGLSASYMVRTERLELSHLAAPEPKSGVSTNFTTSACCQTKTPGNAWRFRIWGGRWGSNPRPQEPQSCALPTELRPPYCMLHVALLVPEPEMAHPAGLEPATIRLEGGCSIQLSYGRFYLQPIRAQTSSFSH